jgi:hypothetical protein
MFIDPATQLPIRWNLQHQSDEGWIPHGHGEAQFDLSLPQQLFDPDSAGNHTWIDVDMLRARWSRQLARAVRVRGRGERSFALRDFQVNREGAVFVLYTQHRRTSRRDWSLELRDDRGTRYLPAGDPVYAPGSVDANGRPLGLWAAGLPVQGEWWVPLVPQSPWRPRRFTVAFRRTLDSATDPRTKRGMAFAEFKVSVAAPTIEVAPEYFPAMASSLGDLAPDWAIRTRSARLRGIHEFDAGRPAAALRWFTRLAREQERTAADLGAPIPSSDAWWYQYRTNLKLGKTDAAREALEEAHRLTRRWGSATPEMKQAFREAGLL